MTRGEAGGRGPDGLIAVRVSDRKMIEQAIALGDLNKRTLGFLPRKAYEQAAAAGTLLAVVDRGQIMAYALYSLPRQVVRLTHLCVAAKPEDEGLRGFSLMPSASGTQTGSASRSSAVTTYAANAMWPHLGFEKARRNARTQPQAAAPDDMVAGSWASRAVLCGRIPWACSGSCWISTYSSTLSRATSAASSESRAPRRGLAGRPG